MDRTKRLRRVGLLCCHFVRNYAYYKAGWNEKGFKSKDQFWISLNGNFLDICVLEWCKLFGDHNDHQHWKKVMNPHKDFKEKMFNSLNINQTELDRINGSFRSYRDKFVAHLDSEETASIPKVSEGLPLVYFYYEEVKAICERTTDWPDNLEDFFKEHYEIGLSKYA
ncbi:hypothetical protein [Rheinheimera gaetbuli]